MYKACELSDCGVLTKLKPFLLTYGILKPTKFQIVNTLYRINHREIDRFLFTETFLKPIYERAVNMEYFTFRKLSKKRWHGKA